MLEEIAGARASCGKPARSAVLLNRCITRAHSTSDARQALEGLGYEVLATAGAGPAHGAGRQRPDAPNPPRRRLGGPRPGPELVTVEPSPEACRPLRLRAGAAAALTGR